MSQSANVPNPGYLLVVGRVDSVQLPTTPTGVVRTLVKLPAPDNYSTPATVEVRSKAVIAQPGQPFEAVCKLHGFKSSGTSERTGKRWVRAENVLIAA